MRNLKGLILAAGEGSRLRPFTFSRPKHLVPLLGKPMIQYPLEDLLSAGISDICIVIGYFGDTIKEVLNNSSRLRFDARLSYVFQERRLGIAHAIHKAIEEGFIDKEFVVYLGDNLISEGVKRYVKEFVESHSDVYMLLVKVKNPSAFGVATIKDNKVIKLIEKPKEFVSNLAVAGIYMFRDPDLVDKAFKTLKPSWRGEYEITELIQWFIDNGYRVNYSVVSGWWKDVGTYDGLLDAIYLLLDKVEPRIDGDVLGEISGRVVVEKDATIEGRVYGPAYISHGVYIGKDAKVEHYVSVERLARVRSGSLTRSLVLEYSEIDLNKARLVESVVGGYSRITCRRDLHGDVKLVASDYSTLVL
ncbi:MAG: glucose-1-phosphate thymidylyltransferase [Desulfurococcaceae archaeon]